MMARQVLAQSVRQSLNLLAERLSSRAKTALDLQLKSRLMKAQTDQLTIDQIRFLCHTYKSSQFEIERSCCCWRFCTLGRHTGLGQDKRYFRAKLRLSRYLSAGSQPGEPTQRKLLYCIAHSSSFKQIPAALCCLAVCCLQGPLLKRFAQCAKFQVL